MTTKNYVDTKLAGLVLLGEGSYLAANKLPGLSSINVVLNDPAGNLVRIVASFVMTRGIKFNATNYYSAVLSSDRYT